MSYHYFARWCTNLHVAIKKYTSTKVLIRLDNLCLKMSALTKIRMIADFSQSSFVVISIQIPFGPACQKNSYYCCKMFVAVLNDPSYCGNFVQFEDFILRNCTNIRIWSSTWMPQLKLKFLQHSTPRVNKWPKNNFSGLLYMTMMTLANQRKKNSLIL